METQALLEKLRIQARERAHLSALRAVMFLEPFAAHFGHLSAPFDVVRSVERGLEMLHEVMTEPEPAGERRVSTADLWQLVVRLEHTELACWRATPAVRTAGVA